MLDIVLYAVVAILLFARLWAMLGEKQDDEPQRPNPFVSRVKPPPTDEENVVVRPERSRAVDEALSMPERAFGAAPPPSSLAGGLALIQRLDATFGEKTFLKGAKAAFGMIVEDFAKGDLSRIERLMGAAVLFSFRQALEARRAAGLMQETQVKDITEADIVGARVEDNRAFLTVDFVSRQINVTRDAQGQIKEGNPESVEEIHDRWVFARAMQSEDPNWQLIETKS